MKKQLFSYLAMLLIFVISCKVTMISGYDQKLEQTAGKMKTEFNQHFEKLSKTLQDNNPNNQKFENFQAYYNNAEADLLTMKDRAQTLTGKSEIVKSEVNTLDSAFHVFITMHKNGLKDRVGDDRRDLTMGINSTLDAIIVLQQSLKTSARPN